MSDDRIIFNTVVSANDAWKRSTSGKVVFIDCRFSLSDLGLGRREYAASHVSGAYYAHLDEDLSGPVVPGLTGRHPMVDENLFLAFAAHCGVTDDVQVFTYDSSGGPFAARAWWLFRYFGHKAVAVVDGGWQAINTSNLTIDNTIPEQRNGDFRPSVQTGMRVEVSDVEEAIQRGSATLVDARATERFKGQTEPIDPVAGHIPGAVSCPFKSNLDESGYFLPVNQLGDRFRALSERGPLISYCGSGVTAAHNVLAMAYAGLPIPALYVGSWSEWITSPERPIETD